MLKANKVKLSTRRKNSLSVKDKDAFKEGQSDSRKIEVRAARIELRPKYEGDAMDLTG